MACVAVFAPHRAGGAVGGRIVSRTFVEAAVLPPNEDSFHVSRNAVYDDVASFTTGPVAGSDRCPRYDAMHVMNALRIPTV